MILTFNVVFSAGADVAIISTRSYHGRYPAMDLLAEEYSDVQLQARLKVGIHVTGSHGNLQQLGIELRRFGHRVRLPAHDVFAVL